MHADAGMSGARTAGHEADAWPACQPAVGLRHVRRGAFMLADDDVELRGVVERVQDIEITLAGNTECPVGAVDSKAVDKNASSASRCELVLHCDVAITKDSGRRFLRMGGERPRARLRQQRDSHQDQAVREQGAEADRFVQRHRRGEDADDSRHQGTDATSEVVGETLAGRANIGREQLREGRAHSRDDSDWKKPSGKPSSSVVVWLTGTSMYTAMVSDAQMAHSANVRRRPSQSLKCAVTT